MRQIVLDTETTGLDPLDGHRIIEIGCVEMVDRRITRNNFHQYLQPDRRIDAGAIEVHGITNEFLVDKPRFAEVAEAFIRFIEGAELIIHNAPFDVGFLNHELKRWRSSDALTITDLCEVTDTLAMARRMHPGQRNGLDALCKRYSVDNSHRELHGALLDAEILADVYLAMTGGQVSLHLGSETSEDARGKVAADHRGRVDPRRPGLNVVKANEDDVAAHAARLASIQAACPDGGCLWLRESSET